MAERRMFAKSIIDSDAFLELPLSSQALYFHFSMRADDEGFINNPKKLQRMVGASDDDYKLLIAKNFVIVFESGIIVIKHWKIHNYIRSDRLHATKYTEERAMLEVKENGTYTISSDICKVEEDKMSVTCQSLDGHVAVKGQTDGSHKSGTRYTEVRLGKDRIDKDSLEEKNEAYASLEKSQSETFITITLNDKSEYAVSVDDVAEYKKLYPAADVEQALRNMKGWCDDHPMNRKTKVGIKRFIGSWLRREQDRGPRKEKGWWE